MIDRVVVAAVVWMFLVAAVIFLAVCRVSTALGDARLDAKDPLHPHLRHVIQASDRIGIPLTATVFICSAFLASMLIRILFPH